MPSFLKVLFLLNLTFMAMFILFVFDVVVSFQKRRKRRTYQAKFPLQVVIPNDNTTCCYLRARLFDSWAFVSLETGEKEVFHERDVFNLAV